MVDGIFGDITSVADSRPTLGRWLPSALASATVYLMIDFFCSKSGAGFSAPSEMMTEPARPGSVRWAI